MKHLKIRETIAATFELDEPYDGSLFKQDKLVAHYWTDGLIERKDLYFEDGTLESTWRMTDDGQWELE